MGYETVSFMKLFCLKVFKTEGNFHEATQSYGNNESWYLIINQMWEEKMVFNTLLVSNKAKSKLGGTGIMQH